MPFLEQLLRRPPRQLKCSAPPIPCTFRAHLAECGLVRCSELQGRERRSVGVRAASRPLAVRAWLFYASSPATGGLAVITPLSR